MCQGSITTLKLQGNPLKHVAGHTCSKRELFPRCSPELFRLIKVGGEGRVASHRQVTRKRERDSRHWSHASQSSSTLHWGKVLLLYFLIVSCSLKTVRPRTAALSRGDRKKAAYSQSRITGVASIAWTSTIRWCGSWCSIGASRGRLRWSRHPRCRCPGSSRWWWWS